MSTLRVESSIGLAQLQDSGRFGVRHLGVTQGGALDWIAAAWANRLLGNHPDCALIEIPLGGLTLRCERSGVLALTGADLGARLDQQSLKPWQSFAIKSGQQLTFDSPQSGIRAYLAAADGFAAPAVLGSRATVIREGLGGPDGEGRALQAGDCLSSSQRIPALSSVPAAQRPDYHQPARLELITGAQIADFSGQSLFAAFNRPWQVDARSDRMGVRLHGPTLRYRGPALVSEGIPLGAVQVPSDGQPIVLLNDRQTIGGYPRLGALTPQAVARLAQCAPGERVHLHPISQQQARQAQILLLRATQ